MLFAQFQARYPTGCLISELLTIHQGKYVVRVSIQVEGVTRATGMAAGESLQLAEDEARNRALSVLGIQPEAVPTPQAATEPRRTPQVPYKPPLKQDLYNQAQTTPSLTEAGYLPSKELIPEDPAISPVPVSDRFLQPFGTPDPPFDAPAENLDLSDTQTESAPKEISFDNVTPFAPRSYAATEQFSQPNQPQQEPIDLSDAIARTSMELKRLGWSNQQGREYLEKTYNKRSRQHLSDEQMLEFLHYLESLPTPE